MRKIKHHTSSSFSIISILFLCGFSLFWISSCEPWDLERIVVDKTGELKIIGGDADFNYYVTDTSLNVDVFDTVSVKNVGNGDLVIDFIESKHPLIYTVLWNGSDIVISPNETKELIIKFKPTVYAEEFHGHIILSNNGLPANDTLKVNVKAKCTRECGGSSNCGVVPDPVEYIPYDTWFGCLPTTYVSHHISCGCGRYYGMIKAKIINFDRNQGAFTIKWENCASFVPFTVANLIATKKEGSDVETQFVPNIDVINKTVSVKFSVTPEIEDTHLFLTFIDADNGIEQSYAVDIECMQI